MVNLLGNFLDDIFNFFARIFKGANFDIIFGLGIGLMAIAVIIGIIKTTNCYEGKTIRGLNRINKYLLQNPAITEENLITFHNYIKKMPQKIRDRWQLYVLERDGLPSRYLTTEYCIRRPLDNSILVSVKKQITLSAWAISALTFILGLGFALANYGTSANVSMSNIIDILIYSLSTPAFVLLISSVFNIVIQFRITFIKAKIYEIFNSFVRNINRAVATMPDGIDYEVLFTQKEIDDGIPILREYLEKKSLEEQQLLEQSKYNAINHSPYNFQDLGVDGEQLISRAVSESENFLMKKIGLENEIQEFEKKLSQSEANMDEIEKEANRKLQTIKENLERLDKAISETTNRVEINYNRRQIKDEMEKKAAIEKDLKSLLAKEQVNVNEYKSEIQKRRDLIDKDKSEVEVALKSEYNTFAVKVYDTLSDKVNEENVDAIKEYQTQILDLKGKVQNLAKDIENKNAIIAERDLEISNFKDEMGRLNSGNSTQQVEKQPAMEQPDENKQAENQSSQIEHTEVEPNLMTAENAEQAGYYYDENGNLVDYGDYYDENGNLIDYSQYYDENGNLIDYSQYYDENGNYIGPENLGNEQVKNQVEQTDNNQNKQTETNDEQDKNIQANKAENSQNEQNSQQGQELQEKLAGLESSGIQEEQNQVNTKAGNSDEDNQTEMQPVEENSENEQTSVINSEQNETVQQESPNLNETDARNDESVENSNIEQSDVSQTLNDVQETRDEELQDNSGQFEFGSNGLMPELEGKDNKQLQNSDSTNLDNLKTSNEQTDSDEQDTSGKSDIAILPLLNEERPVVTQNSRKKSTTKSKASKNVKSGRKSKASAKETEKENDDFSKLQKQIEEENEKIQKEQDELKIQIDNALNKIQSSENENSRRENIVRIRELIEKLKVQARRAKARGATKEEIKRINASVAELLDVIARTK